MEENISQINTENENQEETGDAISGILLLLTIIGVAVLLWCTNPSATDHQDCVDEMVTEVMDEYESNGRILIPPKTLNNIEYHSLGIVSWSTVRYRGKPRIATVGALNYVYPMFEIQ